jgi:RNA polymerase sigma-70 factor (ECF subfamily)
MEKMQKDSDSFVLLALKEGQEKAYDYIFRKYYKALCAQANAYVSDLDLSQSLVQDCFIRFWEKRHQATSIENLASYFSFMVRNKCIDHLRKEHRIRSIENSNLDETDSQESDTLLLSHEFEEKLVEALSRLPDRCRTAFEYSRFENLTYPEIASEMGISVKAVEALISRSLKILRKELKDYLPALIFLCQIVP